MEKGCHVNLDKHPVLLTRNKPLLVWATVHIGSICYSSNIFPIFLNFPFLIFTPISKLSPFLFLPLDLQIHFILLTFCPQFSLLPAMFYWHSPPYLACWNSSHWLHINWTTDIIFITFELVWRKRRHFLLPQSMSMGSR